MVSQQKRYVEIISQIRGIIEADQLVEGDRLPSERELSNRLGVARSSVREALRALELLEFIETRRGEGTFIKEANSRRLVELLLSFLLKDENAKQDLEETRRIIEVEALKLACERMSQDDVVELKDFVQCYKYKVMKQEDDYAFHRKLVTYSKNRLLTNIWDSLVQYNKVVVARPLQESKLITHTKEHVQLVHALSNRNKELSKRILLEHLKYSPF
ncbi:FadR/GntR family transcriptional regulator [Bacillus sp. JCM 19034]|uniref:FadR/GntR family transcriptional regulator n=1 Tax=Bacillus sp. JCM 19034 TaxID=1481928 RepID=UPI00078455AD|nr:FCD domain-containing protein [Bacillus sp. JCM 19034]